MDKSGIGVGVVFSRQAYRAESGGALDPIVATTIRMVAGCAALWVLPLVRNQAGRVLGGLRDGRVLVAMLLGTLVGPLIGMVAHVAALKHAPAGLVSTLSATSPLFILPIVAVRYRARPPVSAIVAAAATVAGVAMIFWKS